MRIEFICRDGKPGHLDIARLTAVDGQPYRDAEEVEGLREQIAHLEGRFESIERILATMMHEAMQGDGTNG